MWLHTGGPPAAAAGGGSPKIRQDEVLSNLIRLFDECASLEARAAERSKADMQIYGLMLKQGHKRKNFTLRLFILDKKGTVSYCKLGETKPRGSFSVSAVKSVERAGACDRCRPLTLTFTLTLLPFLTLTLTLIFLQHGRCAWGGSTVSPHRRALVWSTVQTYRPS